MSEKELEELARSKPNELAALIVTGQLTPPDLTFALEILGRDVTNEELVLPCILPFLDHESAIVREGAVYGLSHHMTAEVKAALVVGYRKEISQAVKQAISDVLEDAG